MHAQAYAECGAILKQFVNEGPLGKSVYCLRTNASGHYLCMVVECQASDGSFFEVELQLPHAYVKLVVTYPKDKGFGFVDEIADQAQ